MYVYVAQRARLCVTHTYTYMYIYIHKYMPQKENRDTAAAVNLGGRRQRQTRFFVPSLHTRTCRELPLCGARSSNATGRITPPPLGNDYRRRHAICRVKEKEERLKRVSPVVMRRGVPLLPICTQRVRDNTKRVRHEHKYKNNEIYILHTCTNVITYLVQSKYRERAR